MCIRKLIKQLAKLIVTKRHELVFDYYVLKLRGGLEPEMALLGKITKRHRLAIDIGANSGLYTYVLSKNFEYVEAFEPIKEITNKLRVYANGKNINLNFIALSDHLGSATLNIPTISNRKEYGLATLNPFEGVKTQLQVEIKTLDDYHYDCIDLIKIDVEGHELDVIRGGLKTIQRCKPVLLVEIEGRHLNGASIEYVFEYIKSLGYEGFFLKNNHIHNLNLFSYEHDQKAHLSDVMSKNYINNFFFCPIENA
jgi:FkbM family methyltransferase